MTKDLLPSLIQQIELYYNQSVQNQAAPAQLVGVSMTLLLRRDSMVSMETLSVNNDITIEDKHD